MAFSFQPALLTNGLILCLDAGNTKSYPGSGTSWTDLSGKNGLSTLTNGPTFSTDGFGSIVFDNSNDYVEIDASAELLAIQVPLTICGWVKPTTAFDAYDVIFSQYLSTSNHRMVKMVRFQASDGSLAYYTTKADGTFQSAGVTSTGNINQWNYFAVSVSGTISSPSATVFLNGTSTTTALSALSSTPDTTVKIRLGANPANNGELFRGNISHISVYNRALTVAEIQQNYNTLKPRFGVR